MDVNRRREELEATIRWAEEQMRNLTVMPIEDVFPDGAMFRVKTHPLGGEELTYLLLKIKDNEGKGWWHHTGRRSLSPSRGWGNSPMNWAQLMAWLLGAARNVTEWTELEPVSREIAHSAPTAKVDAVELRKHIVAVHGYEGSVDHDKLRVWHERQHHLENSPTHPYIWHGTKLEEMKRDQAGTPTSPE